MSWTAAARPRRFAVLTAQLQQALHEEHWIGSLEAAERLGAGLVTVVGPSLGGAGAPPHPGLVDGYLVWSARLRAERGPEAVRALAARLAGRCVVSAEDPLPGAVLLAVDERGAGARLAAHLLAHGRRRIAYLRGPATHEGAARRYEGYRDALRGAGAAHDPALVGPLLPSWDPGDGAAQRAARALLDAPGVDAVMAASDDLALAVLAAAAERGLRVPEDLAVTGFDDAVDHTRLHLPGGRAPGGGLLAGPAATPLTTARVPFRALGARGVELLVDLAHGRRAAADPLPCEVVLRGSCGCPAPVRGATGTAAGAGLGEDGARVVQDVGDLLVTAGTADALVRVLGEQLPRLGVRTLHLVARREPARPPGDPEDRADLLLAHEDGRPAPLTAADTGFPARDLLPAARWADAAPRLLLPLRFAGHELGHLLVVPGPRSGWLYEALGHHLATGLETALLLERLRAGQRELEERVEARTAELAAANAELAAANARLRTQVGERERAEAALAHEVVHDPLTGLANRRMLAEHLEGAVARLTRHGAPLAVLFCDLDDFKWINDHLGHAAGDELLRQLARRMRSALRPEDLLARFAGDEFVVVPADVATARDAAAVAQRVLDACTGRYAVEGGEVFVRLSVGMTLATGPTSAEEVLREADSALYLAKRRGKGSVAVFDAALQEEITRRADVEGGLRRALHDGSLRLLYQPKVDLRTGEVAAVEALLRWQHPVRGLLAPSQFLDVAAESGLVAELGDWVLRRACEEARTWHPRDGAVPLVQVNLAARQLGDPLLADRVERVLAETGLEPARLGLEVAEHRADDLDRVRRVLLRLHRLGVLLSLDDFGAGRSSLRWLRALPLDEVKLDRGFVRGIARDRRERAVLRSVVDLAHALGRAVVAEGVEDRAQRDLLVEAGCDYGQGFALARPVDAATLTHLLDALGVQHRPVGRGT